MKEKYMKNIWKQTTLKNPLYPEEKCGSLKGNIS